ncbi:MAG: hypothetical protein M3441_06475 [Chloroflexota bacterium]|nr:hypothetical protein [Chloroflexota bacterium]
MTTRHAPDLDLASELWVGERVLWRGKPVREAFVWRTWPLSVFGGLLLAAVIAFFGVVLTSEAPGWLALWGVPFGLAALYMLGGHFVLTHREWDNTEYLVTHSRVLIRHGIFTPRLTSYSLGSLPHTQVVMHGDDIGNVMFKGPFGHGYGPAPGYKTMWPYTPGYVLGFMYVRDPRSVQAIIERARMG